MPALLAWFASYLVSALIIRFFVGITFVYVSSSLIIYILSTLDSYLSQFQFYNILLLAGFGRAVSVVGAAFIFKSAYLFLARKS